MTPRSFAIVSPKYYPLTCGVGDHSMRVAEELLRRGHRARVFTRAPASPNPEAPQVTVLAAEGPTPSVVAFRLLRSIERFGPTDLLLQYVPHMWGTRFGSFAPSLLACALRRRGIRVIVLAHELYLPWYRRPDLALGAAVNRAQLAAVLAAADRLVVTTESRFAALARVTPAGLRRRLSWIAVGSNALPVEGAREPGAFRVGLFSTLSKPFEVVLTAFAILAAQVPEAELHLIGDLGPPRPELNRLRASIAAHPAADRVRVTGKLPLARIGPEVARLNVFLFPMDSGANTRSGTLPLALGSGVPVVAICGHETGTIFVGDENVVFADALSGEAFARAALRLHREPGLAERVVAGGRHLYEQRLSWPALVSGLLG